MIWILGYLVIGLVVGHLYVRWAQREYRRSDRGAPIGFVEVGLMVVLWPLVVAAFIVAALGYLVGVRR